MDFYERKQKAIKLIKACYNAGVDIENTYLQVLENFGLGKKIVKEYYSLLEKNDGKK